MSTPEEIRTALKRMIVESLRLDDVRPDDIEDGAPLFGEGLGLDSIDALELAVAIEKRFGVKIQAEDEQNKQVFRSVASLAAHIGEQGPRNSQASKV
jgi:acyl carrier protein